MSGVDRNANAFGVTDIALDVASVAANTTAEQTFTVNGLETDMFVMVNKSVLDAGIGIVNARVSAKDTLALTFVNSTAGAVDPASETYRIFWWKSNVIDSGAVKV